MDADAIVSKKRESVDPETYPSTMAAPPQEKH